MGSRMWWAILGGVAGVACATTGATTTSSGVPTKTSMYAQYDRVKGATTATTPIFIRVPMMGPSVQFFGHAVHADTVLKSPLSHVFFVFKSGSGTQTDGWSFLRDNDLFVLVDDSVRTSYRGTHDGDVGTIILKETMVFRIPTEDLARMGSAAKVEGLLGQWKFVLKPDEIVKLKELAMYASLSPDAPRPRRGRDR